MQFLALIPALLLTTPIIATPVPIANIDGSTANPAALVERQLEGRQAANCCVQLCVKLLLLVHFVLLHVSHTKSSVCSHYKTTTISTYIGYSNGAATSWDVYQSTCIVTIYKGKGDCSTWSYELGRGCAKNYPQGATVDDKPSNQCG